MKIIAGLGNFGDRYAYTYHNMGFLAVECLADKLDTEFKKRECESLCATAYIGGEKIVLAKPLTFMNLSGNAIYQLLKKHKADISELLVVYDDIDIKRGALRFREKGSAGTHNGMRHIIEMLKRDDFARLRIGIGRPEGEIDLAGYVLSEVPKADRQFFYDCLSDAADLCIKWINSGPGAAGKKA